MKTLVIDGNNLLHRVFWIQKTINKDATSNMYILMFLNCIKKYVEMYKPEKIFCCWDEKPLRLKNLRASLNPDYKTNRNKETAAEVYSDTERIKALVSALGIKNLFPLQYEADDVMCYLTKHLVGTKAIITVDKDIFQLVNDEVVVFDPIRKIEINKDNFEKVTGVKQEQFVMQKALKGDKSDNVQGIKGFGDKTIEKYFNGEITLTEEQQEIVERNLKILDLAQGGVADDMEIQYIAEQLREEQHTNFDEFLRLCKEFEFNSIIQKKDKWNELFFFKDQYTCLLETLFA